METGEFSRFINIEQVRSHDLDRTFEANTEELSALSQRFQIEKVGFLKCQLQAGVSANGRDIVLRGHLEAEVTQNCIRTSMPVKSVIEDNFTVILRKASKQFEENSVLDPEEMVDIEYYETPKVNVGEIIAQYLSLNIDPYPKAACTHQPIDVEGKKHPKFKELDKPSPFAVIKEMLEKTKP